MPGPDPFNATTAGVESAKQERKRIPTVRFVFRGARGIVNEPAIVVRAGTTRVGRMRGDDAIALEHDSLASREHATLVCDSANEEVVVQDLGSRNGVAVNGVRVDRAVLADGDVVRLGSSFLVARLEDPLQRDVPIPEIVGPSPAMQQARMAVKRLATEEANVLIVGPTGSGKEVVARALHEASDRKGRFVAVNCSAIGAALAESELFGHVAGAFTGALENRKGYFRAADGGTLLLDEIGDMPAELQPKLLRAIEQREITPVGSTRPVPIDVRVLAATHVDVAARASQGDFRADLYARLAQLRIQLAPLCQRREDILALLQPHLGDAPPMTAELVEALLTAAWPQNVRELVAVATELRVWGQGRDRLDVDLVRDRLNIPASAPPPRPSAPSTELTREDLAALLHRHAGNVAAVAKDVGRSRTQVYRIIEKYALSLDAFRTDD